MAGEGAGAWIGRPEGTLRPEQRKDTNRPSGCARTLRLLGACLPPPSFLDAEGRGAARTTGRQGRDAVRPDRPEGLG